jgi:hypothetical protein
MFQTWKRKRDILSHIVQSLFRDVKIGLLNVYMKKEYVGLHNLGDTQDWKITGLQPAIV